MTAALCPHGLTRGECLICATLATSPADPPPAGRRERSSAARRSGGGVTRGAGGGLGIIVVVVVLLLVAWWLAALLSLILRLAGMVLIAVGSGWVGWRLGVRHGRRSAQG
ncbi:MAG: hypothetical protein ACR2HV_04970 [Acidimicrobiales bacterium]